MKECRQHNSGIGGQAVLEGVMIIDAYRMVEEWMGTFREQLKKFEGTKATEKHEYYDTIRPGQKKPGLR